MKQGRQTEQEPQHTVVTVMVRVTDGSPEEGILPRTGGLGNNVHKG